MHGIRRVLLAVLVVLVVGGIGIWYFVLRDTSPAKLTLKSSPSVPSSKAKPAASLAGRWKVVAGSGDGATIAGYRVQEKFAAGVAKVTATGRTSDVTGSVTVVGAKVTAARIVVDVTSLKSDKAMRDNQIKKRGLETNSFPKATFALATPVTLPAVTEGAVFDVSATGNLTLHGVTRKVTVPLKAKEVGSTFMVQGSLPIVMADYSIEPPSIGGFVSVDDNGAFEFLASLSKA